MKTIDFLKQHNACRECAKWALSVSDDMSDVWDALVEQKRLDWLLWTATRPGVFPASTLRKLACRFVRETPVSDDSTVWDLLKDERSRKAVEVAERYADGNATESDIDAAYAASGAAAFYSDIADAAAYSACYAAYHATRADFKAAASYAAGCTAAAAADAAARDAARAAARAAARVAAHAAAYAASRAAACSAQIKMIAELGNPFQKGPSK